MSVNNKLTHAIKDRVVQKFQLNASELLISFVDGSTMTVKLIDRRNWEIGFSLTNTQF
jgi:hypothetical protein